MGNMMSAGVQINEIDLSIITPQLGNSTACFAGEFTQGPSDKYVLISNSEDLIDVFGKPTNNNYNDWYQCYNFLKYANKLLVSRAVDTNGTYLKTGNIVKAGTTEDNISVAGPLNHIQVGSKLKFDPDSEVASIVTEITAGRDAVKQVDNITVVEAIVGDTYELTIDGNSVSYTAVENSTTNSIASALANLIENVDPTATNASVSGNVITITASIAGTPMTNSVVSGSFGGGFTTVTENVTDVDYILELSHGTVVLSDQVGGEILYETKATNAIVCAPKSGNLVKPARELKVEALFVPNEEEYEVIEASIPVSSNDQLKIIAKSSGVSMNGIEIGIAKEFDFISGTTEMFEGIIVNSLFEITPKNSNREIAIVVRRNGIIESSNIVSLIEGAKDYRNKSVYIDDIFKQYNDLVYIKNNSESDAMPESALFDGGIDKLLKLSNGEDGVVGVDDIDNAYGSVSNNTIFGNKGAIDIDMVIGNEKSRLSASRLAKDRADCIAFLGAKFEDVVGSKSTAIVEHLIYDVNEGELNNGVSANSFSAYFGNYGYIYDKINDKNRWVSLAGDAAGLRAKTNTSLDSWWASAGIDRGSITDIIKLAFNPNQGQRDLLYQKKINPIVGFSGLGNAIIWGQKTLQAKSSSFDRINVRGLFNSIERAISRMALNYLFEFNDSFTRNRFVSNITPFLDGVKIGRGIYDYYVRCDETNNTPQVIDSNQFVADIAVKATRTSEFITLNFISVGTGVDFKEIFN